MTDLSIALDGPRTSGRSSKPVLAELVRELNAADLCLLDLDRGTKPPSLKRLRDHHHRIARLFAEGKRNSEIGMLTGLSQSRISIYRSDPAMMELVEHYSRIVEETLDEAFQHGVEQLSTLRRAAAEELTERLEESPEKFNEEDLMDLLKLTADRTGLGPQTKSTTLNVNMNLADRIAAGRSRAAEAARLITSSPEHETLIEGSVCPSPDALPSPAGGAE